MAKRLNLTAEEVEEEISRLKDSDFVRLAKKEYAIRKKREQYLYSLRSLEKRGRELAAAGLTMDMLYDNPDEWFGMEEDS